MCSWPSRLTVRGPALNSAQPPHTLVQVGAGTQDRGGPPTKEDLESSERGLVGPAAGGSPENSNLGWRQWHQVAPSVEASTDFWEKVDTAFEVRLGQVNEWTIPLPDEFIAAVRACSRLPRTARRNRIRPPLPAIKSDLFIHFGDTLSALLPPHRDDEPATLRQDIIDELSDHLVCAYHRELFAAWIQTWHVSTFWNGSAIRRSVAPALARCNEGEDHGSQRFMVASCVL